MMKLRISNARLDNGDKLLKTEQSEPARKNGGVRSSVSTPMVKLVLSNREKTEVQRVKRSCQSNGYVYLKKILKYP